MPGLQATVALASTVLPNTFVVHLGSATEFVVDPVTQKVSFWTYTSISEQISTIAPGQREVSTFSEISKETRNVSSSATVPQWRRVAKLARIRIDDNEIFELCTQLDSVMSFVGQLSSVNVDGVGPMTSVTPMKMRMREDKVTVGDIADDILRNAPAREGHFFVVPKVVE
jgi:aspartyl-tRNA(Asn)/glutamyl-tRNA(Gln) amidotransferase subunit C